MASRKTYFGIGWPKDPSEPGAPKGGGDAEDRSAPTVVDDEKVAEGLKQLRSWYQSETPPEGSPERDSRPGPAPPPGKLGARPTAVGHATGPPPPDVQSRPIAPDPMRATMYGHDVHQFEFPTAAPELTPTPQQPPPPSNALILADPIARARETLRQQAEAVPRPLAPSPSDAFQLARQGQAERLPRPVGLRRSGPVPTTSALARIPLASKLMFGFGITALVAAIVFWAFSGSGPDPNERPPAHPAPAPQLAAPVPPPEPVRPPAPPAAVTPPSPERPPAVPAARAAAPTAAPTPRAAALPEVTKPQRAAPAVLKTPRRPRAAKPVLPTEVDETAAAAAAPAEKATPEAKEGGREPTEAQDPKAARETKEIKEPKDMKETKAARESKPSKDPKNRSADSDDPMPPSMD